VLKVPQDLQEHKVLLVLRVRLLLKVLRVQ
jgi:hypothetical protein